MHHCDNHHVAVDHVLPSTIGEMSPSQSLLALPKGTWRRATDRSIRTGSARPRLTQAGSVSVSSGMFTARHVTWEPSATDWITPGGASRGARRTRRRCPGTSLTGIRSLVCEATKPTASDGRQFDPTKPVCAEHRQDTGVLHENHRPPARGFAFPVPARPNPVSVDRGTDGCLDGSKSA